MASGPRFLSVGSKLAVGTALLLAAVSAFVYVKLSEHERSSLLFAKRQTAVAIVELFASGATAPLMFNDLDAIQSDIRNIGVNNEIVYAAIWQDGQAKPEGELLRPGGPAARPTPSVQDGEQVEVFADRISVTRSVHDPRQQVIGHVVVQFSLARENAEFQIIKRRVLMTSLALAVALAGALIGLARRMIVKPLDRLASASRKVAAGQYTRVEPEANDEVGRLAEAFNQMSEAIADREQKLALVHRNTRELFDNLGQAVFSFDRHRCVCSEFSAAATTIFGSPALAGRDVLELLFDGVGEHDVERGAFRDWIELAFCSSTEEWSDIAPMAPPEVTLRRDTAQETALVLAFRPLVEHDEIVRILVVATDETDKRRVERTSREKEEQHRQQMAKMRQLVTGGVHLFLGFLRGTHERLDQLAAPLQTPTRKMSAAEIESLFQAAHTIKGEARAFERHDLEARAHAIEDCLAHMRAEVNLVGFATMEAHSNTVLAALSAARECLALAREELVQSSPIGEAVLDQISVRASDVERLASLVKGRKDEVAMLADRLAARPFGELTVRLTHALPIWADARGKSVSLRIDGKETLIPNRLASCLGPVLIHLVRNSLVHGIETPAVREAAGKDPRGHIVIRCVEGTRGPEVEVNDDGAGLDVHALTARAVALGIDVAAGREAELVFVSGLSTATTVDDLAGRGVGMAAVRSDLASEGYCVQIGTQAGEGTTLRLLPASSSVPPSWLSMHPPGPVMDVDV